MNRIESFCKNDGMKQEPRQPPSYPLRLEAETRAKIEAIAKANGRSLNAQIVLMLDEWLAAGSAGESKQLTAEDMRQIALQVVREELGKQSKKN